MDPKLSRTPTPPHLVPLPQASTISTQSNPSVCPPLPESPVHDLLADDIGGDLFPNTAQAIERSTNPLLVPLPPSPTIKPALPHRRPTGWASTLHGDDGRSGAGDSPRYRGVEAASTAASSGRATSNHQSRRSSARLPSGPHPLRLGGRTISGVMQYAIRPPSPSPPASPSVPGTSHPSQQADTEQASRDVFTGMTSPASLSEDGEHVQTEPEETAFTGGYDTGPSSSLEDEPYSLDEIRSSVVGMTDQSNDEVWMSYVRQQLGTLFPDFFQAAGDDQDPSHGVDAYGPRHARHKSASVDGGGPLGEGQGEAKSAQVGWAMVQDGAHHRPMSAMREGEFGCVPNVREEISGLREEIERLRGVVGGLASELYESGAVRPVENGSSEETDSQDPDGCGACDVQGVEPPPTGRAGEGTRHPGSVLDHDQVPSAGGEGQVGVEMPSDVVPKVIEAGVEVKDEAAVEGMLQMELGNKMQDEVGALLSQGLPLAFVKTAALSLDLIRVVAEVTQEAHGGFEKQSDEDIFNEEKLPELKAQLISLLAGSQSQ